MTTRHTEQKYLKLLQHYGDKPVSVTLQELADVLFCTRRHMRNLLLQMQEAKWLIWQSQAGRGHRARLHLRYKPEQLLSERRSSCWSLVMLIRPFNCWVKISTGGATAAFKAGL